MSCQADYKNNNLDKSLNVEVSPQDQLTLKTYTGTAVNDDGDTVYFEKHRYWLDQEGALVKAITRYMDTDNTLIAELTSYFDDDLRLPRYHFKDHRLNQSYGFKQEGEDFILYRQDQDKEMEQKVYKASFFKDKEVMSGQGFHYHIKYHIDELKKRKKKLPFVLLMPGKLDYYSFELSHEVGENDFTDDFKISVQNFALKLIVPSLNLRYENGELTFYKGLSNIQTKEGDSQKVSITYDYGSHKGKTDE